ncbi:MAG: dihydrouridine synthase [Verrucomicrobia bacterium Tous-C9LFEB]|nr:MAG: dihydrouridine synthase [Verrucomicrobia bacterium Tous-C9LFEB]
MSLLTRHLPTNRPALVLAPMQDITDLPFWRVIHHYGDPDLYYTEYFRVHVDSRPERHILRSIDENPSGQPVIAQMIGQDIPALVRTAIALQKHNVVGIDLNLGCPAPIVCRKNAGGGLLRHPEQIDAILAALRPVISIAFTVKTRIGYDSPDEFDRLLEIFTRHPIDALTVHGRTVREMYKPVLHYDRIKQAVAAMPCPVFANGNVLDIPQAEHSLAVTGAAGLMLGRGVIRNPWLFRQLRAHHAGEPVPHPTRRELREYIDRLYRETWLPEYQDHDHVAKMKKYLNYVGLGLDADDAFLRDMRLARLPEDFFAVCDKHLLRDDVAFAPNI